MHLILSALLAIAAPAQSVPVAVGLSLENITAVNEAAETWEMEGELRTSWRDPRLAGHGEQIVTPAEVWVPRMQFQNEIVPRITGDSEVAVHNDGTASYVERFSARLATDLDFTSFPFDAQVLNAIVRPSYSQRTVDRLSIDPAFTRVDTASVLRLSVWKRAGVSGSVSGNTATFVLRLVRDWHVYLYRIILPLLALVAVSWAAFWLPLENYKTPDQLGLSMTALLTVVAFTFTVQAGLPRLSYMTYLDAFLLTSFVSVLLGIVIIVVLSLGHLKDQQVIHARKVFRMVLPIAFIAVQLALAFTFRIFG